MFRVKNKVMGKEKYIIIYISLILVTLFIAITYLGMMIIWMLGINI